VEVVYNPVVPVRPLIFSPAPLENIDVMAHFFFQLPNSLHYDWTMKALAAGKHVLMEKPTADAAEETKAMFELAEGKGLVLLEAFHYQYLLPLVITVTYPNLGVRLWGLDFTQQSNESN